MPRLTPGGSLLPQHPVTFSTLPIVMAGTCVSRQDGAWAIAKVITPILSAPSAQRTKSNRCGASRTGGKEYALPVRIRGVDRRAEGFRLMGWLRLEGPAGFPGMDRLRCMTPRLPPPCFFNSLWARLVPDRSLPAHHRAVFHRSFESSVYPHHLEGGHELIRTGGRLIRPQCHFTIAPDIFGNAAESSTRR